MPCSSHIDAITEKFLVCSVPTLTLSLSNFLFAQCSHWRYQFLVTKSYICVLSEFCKIESQSIYFEIHTITKSAQRNHPSYSLKCDQEIYRLATPDYGQRWLVLNPIPNNKHQANKNSCYTNSVTLNWNKILQLSLPTYCMYCTVVSRGIHNCNCLEMEIILFLLVKSTYE